MPEPTSTARTAGAGDSPDAWTPLLDDPRTRDAIASVRRRVDAVDEETADGGLWRGMPGRLTGWSQQRRATIGLAVGAAALLHGAVILSLQGADGEPDAPVGRSPASATLPSGAAPEDPSPAPASTSRRTSLRVPGAGAAAHVSELPEPAPAVARPPAPVPREPAQSAPRVFAAASAPDEAPAPTPAPHQEPAPAPQVAIEEQPLAALDPMPPAPPPPAEPQAAAPAPPAAGAEARVFVHYSATTPGARTLARELSGHLRASGFAIADVRAVDFAVRVGSVRYFFAEDREEARRLGGNVGAFFGTAPAEGAAEVQDFTHYTPKPRRGNLEVWVPAS